MTEHHQQPSRGYYYEPVYSTSYAPRAREMHTMRQEIPDHIKTLPSCNECGVLFSTLYDLQKHVRKGCPMDKDGFNQDSDSEENSDSAIDFDDSGFNRLVNKVFDEVNEQFQRKCNPLWIVRILLKKRPGMKQQNVCVQSTEPCSSETTRTLFRQKWN